MPIVTMHHISSPKWLITEGGWENEATVEYFKNYCVYVVEHLGGQMEYISTINCASAGVNMFAETWDKLAQMGVQVQAGHEFTHTPGEASDDGRSSRSFWT